MSRTKSAAANRYTTPARAVAAALNSRSDGCEAAQAVARFHIAAGPHCSCSVVAPGPEISARWAPLVWCGEARKSWLLPLGRDYNAGRCPRALQGAS